MDYPPYRPELAPTNFHFFGDQQINVEEELKTAVVVGAYSHAADCFDVKIQNIAEQHDKCLNKNGNYVER